MDSRHRFGNRVTTTPFEQGPIGRNDHLSGWLPSKLLQGALTQPLPHLACRILVKRQRGAQLGGQALYVPAHGQ